MFEKVQRKIILFFVAFSVLYFVGFAIYSRDESNTTKKYKKIYQGLYKEKSLRNSENYQELYEATYTCYSEEGEKRTLTAFIYPQNSNIPNDYYETIEEQAVKEIIDAAKTVDIKLKNDFKKDIQIAHIYKQN